MPYTNPTTLIVIVSVLSLVAGFLLSNLNKKRASNKLQDLSDAKKDKETVLANESFAFSTGIITEQKGTAAVKEFKEKLQQKNKEIIVAYESTALSTGIITEQKGATAAAVKEFKEKLEQKNKEIIVAYESFAFATKILTQEKAAAVAIVEVYKEKLEQKNREIILAYESFALATKTLTKEKRRAIELGNQKVVFLANMSHEIRTPLNGVIGITELLRDTNLTSKQVKLLDTIDNCGNILMTVVNDILDFSKFESSNFEILIDPFNIRDLIEQSVLLYQANARMKNLTIETAFKNFNYYNFLGDETRILQILNNLLSNSIKFSKNGLINILIENLENDEVEISVTDFGIGISPKNQNTIFNSFTQADDFVLRKFGGTGLGLAICKNLCEKMNGSLRVESTFGEGSTFSFRIPLPLAPLTNENLIFSESIKPIKGISNRKMTVLIVDDNEINREVAGMMVEKLGCQFETATNGEEALEKIAATKFDIVLMDMQMPIMGGVEATKKIISKWQDDRPIIVAMTANVLKQAKDECRKAGMDNYLSKPITSRALEKLFDSLHMSL